jgi:hypothetical protein
VAPVVSAGYQSNNNSDGEGESDRVNRINMLGYDVNVVIFFFVLEMIFSSSFALAVDKPRSGRDILWETYLHTTTRLAVNSFGLPLYLDSFELEERVYVDVYGIFDYPFSSIVSALNVPATWCDIVTLHPNVKACTQSERSGDWLLTFYLGRKFYQPPEDANLVVYRYRNVMQQQGYLDIVLTADVGPMGTDDHRMMFEALPLDGGKTFVHVSYSYRDTVALRLAEKLYFTTLGRNKAGFTVTGRDSNDKPILIGGPRGAVERNAVRYYLAIQAYMSTLSCSEESRLRMRLSKWYDLTIPFRRQLFDLEKAEYLMIKTAEQKNQATLQHSRGK